MELTTLSRLIDELSKLPGLGRKSAERVAYHLLRAPREDALALAEAIRSLKERISLCKRCWGFAEGELCPICADERRDHSIVCVVETPVQLFAVERGGGYRGVYHVLHGRLSPLEGVTPDDLKIKELLQRVRQEGVVEVIIATDPDVEGEATATYLAELLRPVGVKVSRPARGLPVGGSLEHLDAATVSRAIEARQQL